MIYIDIPQFDSLPEETVSINILRSYINRYRSSDSYPYMCNLDYIFCYFKCVYESNVEVFILFLQITEKLNWNSVFGTLVTRNYVCLQIL